MSPTRHTAQTLMEQHITNSALRHHSQMVARSLDAYAKKLGEDRDLWYMTGLLHDVDWEEHPDEHPNLAVREWLGDYPEELRQAILAHAPERTGKQAETLLERYLFASDELSGLMHAISLMRPNGFQDMEVKSVKKKLKDKGFAANVSREDIQKGAELIGVPLEEHISFLIEVYKEGQP